MHDTGQKSAILASLVVILLLIGGCLEDGSGSPGSNSEDVQTSERAHMTTILPSEKLGFRLIVAPATSSNTTARVTITRVSEGDTVFDQNVTLDQEHDLSHLFDPTSGYRVRIEASGHVETYGIADYEGYKIYVNESGVVRVEKVVI